MLFPFPCTGSDADVCILYSTGAAVSPGDAGSGITSVPIGSSISLPSILIMQVTG